MPEADASGEPRDGHGEGRPLTVGVAVSHGETGRRLRWRGKAVPAVALAALVLVLAAILGTGALSGGGAGSGRGASGTGAAVSVPGVPWGLAVDERASTVYVAAGQAGLVLLNAAACDSSDVGGCRALRLPGTGQSALAVAVNEPANTIYVAYASSSGAGTIAVTNTAACNFATTAGCSRPAALIHLQGTPEELAIDTRTGTLYADEIVGGSVRQQPAGAQATRQLVVIGGTKACNASATIGCGSAMTLPLGGGLAGGLAVDQTTGTVYTAQASELSVIDGPACAAGNARGCAKVLATIHASGYIINITATGTGLVYVMSPGAGMASVLRTSTCGVGSVAGCAQLALIRVGAGPVAAAADLPAHTVYVADTATNTVSIVNSTACGVTSGACSSSKVAFPVGANPGSVATDSATHTLYVGNRGSRSVSVINAAGCNAVTRRACPTQPPPGTRAIPQTPSTCNPDVAAYQSGQPAALFTRAATPVAAGSTGSNLWRLWARKGVFDPNGIEQGGLVLGHQWYALCSAPLDGGLDPANIELIDTVGHGIVYGYIQYPQNVAVTLASSSPLPPPATVRLHGLTFFIETLPRPACDYHTLILRGHAPGWGGVTALTSPGGCEPGQLVEFSSSQGSWGG
jgi:DNA-binding beta-propeller fold protein YncE